MKEYNCYVYERNLKFFDFYFVIAKDKASAKAELKRRLDEETDTGADSYNVIQVVEVK